ncbi:MAG TPA: phospholipase D-like domain-containing protein [Thermoanaerobaculia bacterium]|nr:phospholipase D-like domain-containing protein [Thermoanaerobaculia bacterium]
MSTILATAVITMLATLLVVTLVRNVTTGEKSIEHDVPSLYGSDSPQLERVLGSLLSPPLVDGNRVEGFQNGDEIFPPMLAAIRAARHSVCLETYIYWQGQIAEQFADALAERAGAGVRVHVLLDWLGSSRVDPRLIGQMKRAGVEVERYHPIRWYQMDRLNHRTHRKLLVVDGKVGFTGGVGIGDEWTGNAQDPQHWRDSHYRVEGPAVAQMQAAFQDNWLKTHAEVLHSEAYFPPLAPAGAVKAQMFRSSPREGSDSVRLMYLLAIAAARREILIANAYFVPDDLALRELVEAAGRGVRIRIVLPGPITDAQVVRSASRARWGDLLEAGAEFYEYQPTMYHCKIFIVDRRLASVGSTNFDSRSFRLNDEANLNVLDRGFAESQAKVIEDDIGHSRRMTLEAWRQRPWRERAADRLSALLRSQF